MTKVKKNQDAVAEKLGIFLADTAVLAIKTLNYHWNMVGPQFFMYHKLLEEQYKELNEALDVLAERIRQIGPKAPATLKEFLELSTLKEGRSTLPQEKMVQELSYDHLLMVKQCHALIEISDEKKDQGTSDLLINRLRAHDKNAWLLKSHLKA